MEDKKIVTPVQPYLTLDAEDYQELLNRRMGISSFYEFNVKNGNSGNFRAVPDGSTDLVFGIGEKDVKVLIILGQDFCQENVFCQNLFP